MGKLKKTTFICGRYGSGKTTVALNLAFMLSESGTEVGLVDLDVVNPYFRSSDLADRIEYHSIKLFAPKANDTVIIDDELLPNAVSQMKDESSFVVVDVGADEEGFEAMRHLSSTIDKSACDVLYVVNFSKTATDTSQKAFDDASAFCRETGFEFTGIINNTQAGGEADQAMIDESIVKSDLLSKLLKVPVVYHCYNKNVNLTVPECGMPIEIYVTPSWLE